MPPTAAASHGAQGAVRVSSKTLFLVLFVPRRRGRKEGVRHFPPFATKIGEEALKEKWSKYAWKAPPLLSLPLFLSLRAQGWE